MVIDNFDLIKQFLQFPNERSFYFIQVLKRKKENPEMKTYVRQIETYYVFNLEQFERVKEHVIERCEQHRARAYIKLNTLDANSVGLTNIAILTQELRKRNWKGLSSGFNAACGQCGKQDGTEKLYLIDLDDLKTEEELKPYIDEINQCEPLNVNKVKLTVPTKNGTHIITTGFDLQTFKQKYPHIDIHEDGNTILYIPDI